MPAKNINLLPQKDFDQTPLGKFLRWSLTYGRYIIVCTEIVVLLAFIYRFSLDRKITDLNEEIDQKTAIIKANAGFEQSFRNLQKRTEQIGTLITDQDLTVKILRHLESITPEGIAYATYAFSQSKLSISGTSMTDADLVVYLNNLKTSPYLTDINLSSLSKISAGTTETKFQIETALKGATSPKTVSQ